MDTVLNSAATESDVDRLPQLWFDGWQDARELGRAAGEAAAALCSTPDITALAGTEPFESPGGNTLTSINLEPIPITQDNLDVVLDAGWIDQATLCEGVEAGALAACG